MNVIFQLEDHMLRKLFVVKYLDLGNPVIYLYINKNLIYNTLIYLGSAIDVMTKYIILGLYRQELLKHAPIILQLEDRSIVNPKGVFENVMVSIYSWDCPIYFIVFQTKSKLDGYPLILGIHWLVIAYAYSICRVGNMTITNGQYQNKLVLSPPTKTLIEA